LPDRRVFHIKSTTWFVTAIRVALTLFEIFSL